jgi:FAD-dependent urate hydroxylase
MTRDFFGYLVRDGGEVWWFANAAHPVSSTAELAAVPPERWRQRLLDLFSDDLPVVRRIIAASSDRIGAHPVFDIPTSRRWSRGPVVLIGDAVHATSPSAGQGASLAIEDAVVLATCLRDIPEPARAFAHHERLRRERVEKVVAYARKRGGNKTAGPVARVLRDAMMPLVLRLSASDRAHAWMYRCHIDWDAPVEAGDRRGEPRAGRSSSDRPSHAQLGDRPGASRPGGAPAWMARTVSMVSASAARLSGR